MDWVVKYLEENGAVAGIKKEKRGKRWNKISIILFIIDYYVNIIERFVNKPSFINSIF